LRSIEANAELLEVSAYVETMIMRVRTLLSDTRMGAIIGDGAGATLADWLNTYIGNDTDQKASITVIDLSLVPAEVVHIVTAVIARMTIEAQQRYRNLNKGKVLPTVLVMEEAHTFVKRYRDDVENQNTSAICCQVFEKIAREGRKFGLGLVLSSQRPSELSPTVLSQCNTFLLHRISNDRDQELVHKLVPDNLRGLLRDLPSLPARQAILLGWASELPTLVEMRYLSRDHRPMSADPDFWAVWTRTSPRPLAWEDVARDWQQYGNVSTHDQAAFGEAQ
jgi:DNA helicase HerA-like ATPase